MLYRLVWAGIYVLLWGGFGIWYSTLSGQNFYHSNVSREPVVDEYKRNITAELQEVIRNGFIDRYGKGTYWDGNWGIDAATFIVRDLNLNPNQKKRDTDVSFKLSVQISDKSQEDMRDFTDASITFSAADGSDVASANGGDPSRQAREKALKVEMPEIPDGRGLWDKDLNDRLPSILFPTKGTRVAKNEKERTDDNEATNRKVESPSTIKLQIPKGLDSEILNLAMGIQGDPSNLEGHVVRMLYLSAVTITTLGYGDIAPLTTKARSLITAEAVAGIIVIGFLISGGRRREPGSALRKETA